MMKNTFFQRLSIRAKLYCIIIILLLISLSFTFAGIIAKERFILKSQIAQELNALTSATAYNSAAAITFEDEQSALENLKSLHFNSNIVTAALFFEDKTLFVEHKFKPYPYKLVLPDTFQYGETLQDNYFHVYQPIKKNNQIIGTVAVIADLISLNQIIKNNIIYTSIIFTLVLFVTLIFGALLQRSISRPLLQLTNLMQQVSADKNYHLRMPEYDNTGKNEIYLLSKDFNEMLENINWRDKELDRYSQHLEQLVHERTTELEKAKLLAEASNQAKSEFLANITHELRTPMVGVLGMLDLLYETKTDTIQKDYIDTAQNSAQILLEIINEVLDFSKIEAGQFKLEDVNFDIIKTVENIIIVQAEIAYKKKLELSLLISNDVPEYLIGDKLRLKQMLNNLISNAIKFTEQGNIIIRISLKKQTQDKSFILFEIEDTGIGIPKEKQAQLFTPFTQADTSTTRKYGGTGLGLSIVKKLVELQKGEIGFDSIENQGSRFWFCLPFATIKPILPTPNLDFHVLTIINNKSILNSVNHYLDYWHIEHNSINMKALATELEKPTPSEKKIDRVIIDEKLIKKESLELINSIKQNPLFQDIHFIIVTKYKELELENISGYMFKPILRDSVYQALTLQDKFNPIKTKPTTIKQKNIRVLLAEDNKTNQKIIIEMLTQLGLQVTLAENGQQALEKLNDNDFSFIFMDCLMPVMDGFDATQRIRQLNSPKKDIPIIALTANATENDRKKCLAVGMSDFISKPFRREQIIEKIETWTNHDRLST